QPAGRRADAGDGGGRVGALTPGRTAEDAGGAGCGEEATLVAVATVWRPKLSLASNGEIALQCSYEERHVAKRIPGWRWDKATKTWRYPAKPETLAQLRAAFPWLTISEEVIRAVDAAKSAEADVAALKEAEDADIDLPTRLPLYAHQRRMAAMALRVPAFAWFAEMGTGKTAAAVAVAGERFRRGEIQACLVVAPKSVLPVWQREFMTFAAFPYHVKVLEGSI